MKTMEQFKYQSAIDMRFYPNYRQKRVVAKNDGFSRFVYNKLVDMHNELYRLRKVKRYLKPVADRIAYLEKVLSSDKEIKNTIPFYGDPEIDSSAYDNAKKNYGTAWKNMKERHTGVPTFHKKSSRLHYQTSNHYTKNSKTMNDGSIHFIDKDHLHLPVIGDVRIGVSPKQIDELFKHFDGNSRIGTAAVRREPDGRYFVSIKIASDEPFWTIPAKTGNMLGIDVNVENLLTTSDNDVYENKRITSKYAPKLAKAQKNLARKREAAKRDGRKLKDSKNYQKQRTKVAIIYQHMAAEREDYLDVVSKKLVENQDAIFSEDLKVKNMVKNHCLAKAIEDVSWGTLFTKIDYKAKRQEKIYLKVPAKNTTQTCSCCQYVLTGDEVLTLKDRTWVCPNCGAEHSRDHNSGIVVKQRGIKMLSDLAKPIPDNKPVSEI